MTSISSNSIQTDQKKIPTQSPKQRKLMLLTLGLLRNLDISDLTYLSLLFIQFLQTLSIIINGIYYSQWQNIIFTYIKQSLSYITLYPIIKQYQTVHIGLLITSITILIIIGIAMIIILQYSSQMLVNISQLQKILIGLISFFIILAKTILSMPLLFIMLSGLFYIQQSSNLIIGLSIGLILLYIPYFLYLAFIFTDINPFNTFIIAGQTHYSRIANLLLKLSLVLYTILDRSHKFELEMLIILCVIKFISIIILHYYSAQQQFNYKVRMYQLWEKYVVIIIIVFIVVAYQTAGQPKLLIYMLILILSVIPLLTYIQQSTSNSILHQNFNLLQQTHKIQSHTLKLIQLIDTAHQRSSRTLLAGYVTFHVRNCNLPDLSCICRQISNNNLTDLQGRKHLYYQFLVNLLRSSINRASQPRRIYVLLSFIFQYRLNNRYQAIHSLIQSRIRHNSIIERLEYLKQMKLVQTEMAEYQSKRSSNMAIDMMRFLKFNLKIVQFQKILDQCTNNHIEFWNQVLQINLNIQKLQQCGAIIANQKQAVKQYFQQMQQFNSNNAHIMILYGQFLSWVCNQDFQNAKLLEKGQTILKNIKQSSKINGKNQKYSENSRTVIIIISGNQKQLGRILQTNNYIKQAIGYNRKDLINQNIQKLMPKIFAEYHTKTLQKFLSTSKDRYNGIQRLVPVLRKDGFILPTLAYTKPIPNLQQGIQIVGFLSQYSHIQQDQSFDQKVSYILYQCNSQIIMGISKNCQSEYGIPQCLVYGNPQNTINQLKIKHIFGINFQKNQRGIQNGKQIIATLDTKALKQQFVIANINSTRKIIDQNKNINMKSNNPIKIQVLVRSVLQLNYHGFPIRMISVVKDSQQKQDNDNLRKSLQLTNQQLRDQKSDSKSQTDDLKDLKDFKNFISIRRQPQALRYISMACIILIIIFTIGTAAYIVLHLRKFQITQATINGIQLAFKNRMYTTELSFQADKLFLSRNNQYPNKATFNQIQAINKMTNLISQAKLTQIKILPIKYYLQVSQLSINNYNVYTNGLYKTDIKSIDQSITIQLSKLYNIVNTNLSYLQEYPLNYKSLTVLNYMQIQFTQIFSLISACNQIQYQISNQGMNQNQKIKLFIIIVAIVLVAFSIIWISVSLPKTLQVVDINSKVLSLFNLISPYDVQGVIKRCNFFQSNYLVETNAEKKQQVDSPPNVFLQSKKKQVQLKQNQIKQKGRTSLLRQSISPLTPLSPSNQLNSSALQTSSRVIVNPDSRNKESVNFDNFDYSQKNNQMINKGNGDKIKAVLTFIGVFLFVTAYAGSVTGYLIINYNLMQKQTNTMNAIYNRTAQFQQIKTTFTKYLMNRTLNYNSQTISSINIDLINKIYDTQRSLVQDNPTTTISQLISQLNTQNICNIIKNYTDYKIWGINNLNNNQCSNIDNGVLTRGIKTSLVTIMQQIRSMILLPQPQKQKINMYNQTIQTINRYSILQKYIVRPLIMISQQIIQDRITNTFHINMTFYLINGFFLLSMLIFWKIAWRKYLEYLNQSVWRTKSMLNVIPSKIITNNQILMNQFTSGQLEKIVR